jgi:hypothetical protein
MGVQSAPDLHANVVVIGHRSSKLVSVSAYVLQLQLATGSAPKEFKTILTKVLGESALQINHTS